jgi:hypothetical protein
VAACKHDVTGGTAYQLINVPLPENAIAASHLSRVKSTAKTIVLQASLIVSESGGKVMEAQGELITTQYFDSLAAEINDLLQVCCSYKQG